MNQRAEVLGVALLGYTDACVNLKYITPSDITPIIAEIDSQKWYPLELMHRLDDLIARSFENPAPVFECIGEEMMLRWHREIFSGEDFIKGVDFLKLQKNSQAYHSLVKGPIEVIGKFLLEELDEDGGHALLRTTTPSPNALEQGILYGGMKAPGDLAKISITQNKNFLKVEFS